MKVSIGKLLNDTRAIVNKNAPMLYMAAAGVGTVATVILTIHATRKATQITQDLKTESKRTKLSPSEVVKATWKCYIPVAIAASASIGCMALSTREYTRREGSLATALALTETAKSVYRDEVKNLGGSQAVQHADTEVSKAVAPILVNSDAMVNDSFTIFEDDITNARYYARPSDVCAAFEWADKEMDAGEEVQLESIWDHIGLQISSCWASENLYFKKRQPMCGERFKPRWESVLTDDFRQYIRVVYPWEPYTL